MNVWYINWGCPQEWLNQIQEMNPESSEAGSQNILSINTCLIKIYSIKIVSIDVSWANEWMSHERMSGGWLSKWMSDRRWWWLLLLIQWINVLCPQFNQNEYLVSSAKCWDASQDFVASRDTKHSFVLCKVDRKNPPPPGGFPIYYVPSSRIVCKRTPLEGFVPGFSRGVLLHTILDEGIW